MMNDSKDLSVVFILSHKKGGMVHYTVQLVEKISKNCQVTIIGQKEKIDYDFNESINVINLLEDVPGGLSIFNIKKIVSFYNLREIKKINPDVIHVTIPHPLTALFLIPLRKYPIVITIHEPDLHEGADIYERLIDLSYKIFFRISNKILVHCLKAKKILSKRGVSPDKIEVVPHGDYSFFTKYTKKFPKKRNHILFFGHIREYKGLKYLIQAMNLIIKEIPDVKLIIAGDGDFSKYESLIFNENNFEIINEYIPDKLTSELFEISEIVVLPYIQATQSGVLNIAYAFKKPVITTDVGCIPEYVDDGKTGLIVPPKNPEALSNAIISLLKNNNLRKQMGENAFQKMETEFSWDKIAQKTIGTYKKTINTK